MAQETQLSFLYSLALKKSAFTMLGRGALKWDCHLLHLSMYIAWHFYKNNYIMLTAQAPKSLGFNLSPRIIISDYRLKKKIL